MIRPRSLLEAIGIDEVGTLVIESAFVLPVLLLMSLGTFEVCQLVARNTEMQSAMSEATAISLASRPRTQGEIDTIENIIEASTGLDDEHVVFARRYRCGTDAGRVDNKALCPSGSVVAEFVEITMSETYRPVWTGFGIGSDVELNVTRTVQIS